MAHAPSDDDKTPHGRSQGGASQGKLVTYGVMNPLGGGDPIPLLKKTLLIGRRESCDIVLRFANVSAHHCQLYVVGGYWYVKDLKSRNGVRINSVQVAEGRIDPGDEFAVSNHHYEFTYSPIDLGAVGPPPPEELPSDIFTKSLLERAGLDHRDEQEPRPDPLLHDHGRPWQ